MDCAVSDVVGHDTSALTVLHDQIKSEVLNKEDAVIAESATEKCVQHGVTGSVSDRTASVGLATFAVLGGLTTESSLVDFALGSSAEGHTVGLEFTDSDRSLTCHVLNSVLVSEPVTTLDRVVEVVLPTVLVHISESCVDSALY